MGQVERFFLRLSEGKLRTYEFCDGYFNGVLYEGEQECCFSDDVTPEGYWDFLKSEKSLDSDAEYDCLVLYDEQDKNIAAELKKAADSMPKAKKSIWKLSELIGYLIKEQEINDKIVYRVAQKELCADGKRYLVFGLGGEEICIDNDKKTLRVGGRSYAVSGLDGEEITIKKPERNSLPPPPAPGEPEAASGMQSENDGESSPHKKPQVIYPSLQPPPQPQPPELPEISMPSDKEAATAEDLKRYFEEKTNQVTRGVKQE